jgi:hypothetical protein
MDTFSTFNGTLSYIQLRILITFILCSFILFPLPHWILLGMKTKYEIVNKIMSVDEEDSIIDY